MSKGVIWKRILPAVLFLILSIAVLPLKGSATTYRKVIVGNYIDYTAYQKKNVILMKMHKNTTGTVEWSSTDTKVAVVKSTGKISAKVIIKDKGTCKIKAKVDGKTYVAYITAGKGQDTSRSYITMKKVPTQDLMVGDTFTLKASLKPATLSVSNVAWKSSNTSIASITQKGVVTLKKTGKVTITAYYTKNHALRVSATLKVNPKTIYISKVKLTGPTTGYVGKTAKFKATITPSNATNKTLTWSTSNSEVATVNQYGTVTCKKAGKVKIKVTTNDGTNQTVTSKTMTVVVPRAEELYIETSKIPKPLKVGDSFTLTATVKPTNARNKNVYWYSDDDNVVSIDDNGKITCNGTGEANITVESADPDAVGLTYTLPLTVYENKNYIKEMTITGPDIYITGRDVSYSVKSLTCLDSTKDCQDKITWTSSDPSVAYVVEGDNSGCKLHTSKIGKTTLTATTLTSSSTKIKAQLQLEVKDSNYPVSLEITKIPTWTLYEDSVFTMVVTLKNAIGETVSSPLTWKSSNTSVATVNPVLSADDSKITVKATVMAHKSGNATITITSDENPELTAKVDTKNFTFTFNKGVAVTGVDITNVPTGVIEANQEFDLTAVVIPSNATDRDISWVSSDPEVATVDENGHVHTLKDGKEVTIMAYLTSRPGMYAAVIIPVGGYAHLKTTSN